MPVGIYRVQSPGFPKIVQTKRRRWKKAVNEKIGLANNGPIAATDKRDADCPSETGTCPIFTATM